MTHECLLRVLHPVCISGLLSLIRDTNAQPEVVQSCGKRRRVAGVGAVRCVVGVGR